MKYKKNDLVFLPLGGCNEIGMNLNLYHYKGKWLMVDFGAGFAEESLPGVDMLVPDIEFLLSIKKDLLGLVLTHAHEDHLGAIRFLWDQVECPIYATPFTAGVVRAKVRETGFAKHVAQQLIEIDSNEAFDLSPFSIEMVQITHSIPEMNGLVIKTDHGTILHTGDWKLDPGPVVGPTTDEKLLKKYGDEGVLALVCDSTNVFSEGHSGSEADLKEHLSSIIASSNDMVFVTTFASNVARLQTIAEAAMENGRKVALAGRSLWTITNAARECGYLADLPDFLTDQDIKKVARKKALVICTGCQGEPMAAMSKIIHRSHPMLKLHPGDTVIFSSKVIPGNERKIFNMFNALTQMGAEVYTEKDHYVHVSGHPCRDEVKRMYELTRPKISIPVHGEPVHIHEHIKLAKSYGVPQQIETANGLAIKLAPGKPSPLGHVQSGYFAVDGNRLLPLESDILRTRRKIGYSGTFVLSLAIAKNELMAEPHIYAPGIFDEKKDSKRLRAIKEEIVELFYTQGNLSDDRLIKMLRKNIRGIIELETGKRPGKIEIQLLQV